MEQPAGVQYGAVAAKSDDKVERVRSRATHLVVPIAQARGDCTPIVVLFQLAGLDELLAQLFDQATGIEPLVILKPVLEVDVVSCFVVWPEQPFDELPRAEDEIRVVDFGENEDVLDPEANAHATQPPAELSHAPRHLAELLFGEQPAVQLVFLRWAPGHVRHVEF